MVEIAREIAALFVEYPRSTGTFEITIELPVQCTCVGAGMDWDTDPNCPRCSVLKPSTTRPHVHTTLPDGSAPACLVCHPELLPEEK